MRRLKVVVRFTKKLFSLLTKEERRKLYLLFIFILVMAFLQTVSIASVIPFLNVASDPGAIESNRFLSYTYNLLGFQGKNQFIIFLGVVVLAFIFLSNGFRAATTWFQNRYAWGRYHTLSKRLLSSYMDRPYSFFLDRNSSELSENILQEVNRVIISLLLPGLRVLAKGTVSIFIFTFLMVRNPIVATLVTFFVGGIYSILYVVSRKYQKVFGEARHEANQGRFKSVREAMDGIKSIKIFGKEEVFLDRYSEQSWKYTINQARHHILRRIPKFALEIMSMGTIMVIALSLLAIRGELRSIITPLGVFAFAGYRLMPALHQVFSGLSALHFNQAALESVHKDIKAEKTKESGHNPAIHTKEKKLILEDKLELDNVTYYYPNASQPSLRGVNMVIEANSIIGIVGSTGSGKTTTVDVILGLLVPKEGKILVDGEDIHQGGLKNWQANLGYVPQSIYLADDSIERNIAFGVPDEIIDEEKVISAARKANIHDFIHSELSEGYGTEVGERGVRLSGGQKQRIGIARALYFDRQVLILDEATSNLDRSTEESILNNVHQESSKTVITISHRISTVKPCDSIYVLNKGEIANSGTYEQLNKRSEVFQKIADSA